MRTTIPLIWWLCLFSQVGWTYPSNFWHFNTLSTPGPGLAIYGNVTPGGALLMDGSPVYGLVNSSIIVGGEMTFVFRFFPTSTPANSRIIDFGNGPGMDNIIIYFDTGSIINFRYGGVNYTAGCGGLYQLNQWNTVAIAVSNYYVFFFLNGQQCNIYYSSLSQRVVRNYQYIAKSNWNDPTWIGQLDFVWHIARAMLSWELTVVTRTEGDLMANAWTFQSTSTLLSSVSLLGSPDLSGGTLNLHANASQAAMIDPTNFTIGGPFSIAARVRMDSYQSWARVIDFSNNGVDGIVFGALGTTDSASVVIYRGTQAQTLTCGSFWQLGKWVDIFLRVSGTNIGVSRGTVSDCSTYNGWEPLNGTRSQMWIGKSSSPGSGWDGAFQYVAYFPRVFDSIEILYLSTVYQATNYVVGSQFTTFDSTFVGVGAPTFNRNGSVYLNGSASQYIQLSSSVILSTPFTISASVFTEVTRSSTIFEFGNDVNQDNVILVLDSNSFTYTVINNGVAQTLSCISSTYVGQWIQFILVHDGFTGSIYSNGNSICSGSMSAVLPMTRSMQYIGKSIDPKKLTWQGYFDYFLMYDRALSNEEIYFNPLGLDRNNVFCNAASLPSPRANMGTCVGYAKQSTTCKLACNSPYIGLNVIPGVCTTVPLAESAMWINQSISCVARCSNLSTPVNGSISCFGPYGPAIENGTCSFTCSVGFSLVGYNSTTCTAAGGGSWAFPSPTCAAVNCSTPVVQYGTASCSGAYGPTQYTATCSFSCPSGFTRIGAPTATCLVTGQWSSATPSCVPVTCPSLSLTAGTVACQNLYGSWTYGTSCSFACGTNYTISGPQQVVCGANAQWNASLPVCTLVFCPSQSPPVNGAVQCDKGAFSVTNSVTSKCDYSCVGGYTLSSTVTQVCLNTGQWSVLAPICVDMNECLIPTTCPFNTQCFNTNGSYMCTPTFTTPILSVTTGTSILPSSSGGDVKFSVYMGFGVTPALNSTTYTLLSSGNAVPIYCSNLVVSPLINSIYNVTCTIGPGLGAEFRIIFPYSSLGTLLGVIASSSTFSYPTPTIDPGSLRIVGYPPAPKVFSLTYTKGDIVSFTGTGFLADSTLLSVTYAPFGFMLASPCTLILASCNETTITCRTQPMSSGLDMVFTVNANGVSVTGTDTFSINNVPSVVSVTNFNQTNPTSCLSSDVALYDCPTTGNIPIVIIANYISETFLSGFIGGLHCEFLPPLVNDSGIIGNFFFSCMLPPGTGFNRTVVVASDGKYSQSRSLLSYAAPTIFNLSGCSQLTALTVTNCPRQGGNSLIVIGINFGADGSSVSVGGTRCISTIHDILTPHNRVVCVMPPGFSVARQVQLYQAAGPFSQSAAAVDYLQCGPGTFQQSSDTVCGVCQPGQYSSLSGAFTCLNCDPGRYAPQNQSTTCLPCEAGTAQPSGGVWNCTICGPGYYTNRQGSLSCVACDSGTNSSGHGSTGCSRCDAGRVAPQLGMALCTACDAGYAAGVQQSQCQQCPAGTFSLPGASVCMSCQPGHFQPIVGSSFCYACISGSYSATFGRIDCIPCESGYATNDTAATSCEICLAGSVSSRDLTSPIGPTECTMCDPGKFTEIGGQAVCIACSPGYMTNISGSTVCYPCDPGYSQPLPSSTKCEACPLGSYTALPGRPDCILCGFGTQSNVSPATACTACDAGTFSTRTGAVDCSPCPPGTYVNTVGQVACFLCATGSASPNPGAKACTLCPPGSFASSGGSQDCSVCLPGRYTGVPGQESCSQCDVGKYSPHHNSTACIDCAKGSHQSIPGQSFCDFCQAGQYTGVSGQNMCSVCPVGKYTPTSNSSACIDCEEGFYQNVLGQGSCEGCIAGRYAPVQGRELCNPCNPGSYNIGDNSSSCIGCPPGSYQPNPGFSSCLQCPAGYFSSASAQSACVPCSPGTFSNASGLKMCTLCPAGSSQGLPASSGCVLCGPGMQSSQGSTACQPCPTGLWAAAPGTAVCSFCPRNSAANIEQTRCDCNPGFYLDQDVCYVCPVGTTCGAKGVIRSEIPVQGGYLLSDNETLTYQKCLSPKSCVGGVCVGHRTGPLCSLCESGYSMSQWTRECTPCQGHGKSVSAMVLTILGLLVAVFLLFGYIIHSALRAHEKALEAEKRHTVTHRAPKLPPLNHPTNVNQSADQNSEPLSPNSSSRHSSREQDGIVSHSESIDRSTELFLFNVLKRDNRKQAGDNTYILKIIVNFFQVASSLVGLPVAGAIAFPTYYMVFLSYFKFFNIDLIPWENVSCLFPTTTSFYKKLVTLTVLPVVLIITLLCVVFFATVILDFRDKSNEMIVHQRRRRMRYVFVRGAILTVFMLYPLASSTILSHFVCLKVGPQTLLISDFSIECYGALWNSWTPFVVVMVIMYPIGIPALLFFILHQNRKDLQSPSALLGLGFLYESYRPGVWWFEVLAMVEKLTLTSLLQFLPLSLQLGAGIAVCTAFLVTVVLVQPEVRARNWMLHMLANVEILMLLLVWHFSYNDGISSAPVVIDAFVSALFIVLTIGVIVLMFMDILRLMKVQFFLYARKRAEQKERKERIDNSITI